MTNSELLAIAVDDARKYTMVFGNKLIESNVDLFKNFDFDGIKLNSAAFILGHHAVTENFLCLSCTGGEIVRFPWAKTFALGVAMPSKEEYPPLNEILGVLSEVHLKALHHIKSLSDSDLEKPNTKGVKFATDESIRSIILHAVRHESSHAGHLSWLCKLHGIKTF
jgi:hypothetical protein